MRYMNMNKKDSTKPSMEEILVIKDQKKRNEAYNQYVENMTPKSNCFANCAKAFLVGGLICTLGEGLILFMNIWEMKKSWRLYTERLL